MATHSSIPAWRISLDTGAWWAVVHGVSKSQTQLSDEALHMTNLKRVHLRPKIKEIKAKKDRVRQLPLADFLSRA